MTATNPLWRAFEWWLRLLPPLVGAVVDGVIFGVWLSPWLFRGSTGRQAVFLALVLLSFVYASYGLRAHVHGVR